LNNAWRHSTTIDCIALMPLSFPGWVSATSTVLQLHSQHAGQHTGCRPQQHTNAHRMLPSNYVSASIFHIFSNVWITLTSAVAFPATY
jgi:hypothetical protein